jgi:AraC-like DNA-binding protein
MAELTVAAGYARALFAFAVAKGAPAECLSDRSGFDPCAISDPLARMPFATYMKVMRAGKELSGDPALALHFGEQVDLSEITVGCVIGGFAESGGDAFALMNRYSRLGVEAEGVGNGDRYVLERRPGQLWMIDTRRNPNDFPELTETTFARMVCMSRQHRSGRPFFREVHVTHPEPVQPAHRGAYDRVLRIPVVFGSDRNAMLFVDDRWVAQRLPTSSPPVLNILSAHAEARLAHLERSATTRARVEHLIIPVLHGGGATVDAIAGRMGLSRQTLFRKLKAEGATFEQVLDELRHRLALDYLGQRETTVNQTARLVGFSDPAAFSRAFKRWTGCSPRTYVSRRLPA